MSPLFTFHYILTLSASSDPTRHVEDFYDIARPGEGRKKRHEGPMGYHYAYKIAHQDLKCIQVLKYLVVKNEA